MASAFSAEQIERYLDYISLPPRYRDSTRRSLDSEFLKALHTYHVSAIPYENLSLHYSKDGKISLDPQVLYHKMTKNGRGGYCMENSIFFNHVLRALGFEVYLAGARIRYRVDGIPQGNYSGWVHVVNIVTLPDGSRYSCDVGFGGDGPRQPLPLVSGHITPNIGTQELRLIHETIPELSQKDQKLWIYQYRNGSEREWNSFYSFPELEFLENDFYIMNYYTSTHPESFQTYTPLVVKFLRQDDEIYGKVMLVNNELKQNHGGKTQVVKVCQTEEDRVQALKEY
ncbi:cysteine proteinase [Heliocybe sulcata]|uniref:Cysteine proteinase n=1 Tax=Heliocybe sulcata TaxID=5364 RepID=A0A5C3N7L0_9AGAM|nr:cysteine proteinase [Heliocybe sulcata]